LECTQQWQANTNGTTNLTLGAIENLDFAAICTRDRSCENESHPESSPAIVILNASMKSIPPNVLGHANPCIADVDQDVFLIAASADSENSLLLVSHGPQSIADQVVEYLADPSGITANAFLFRDLKVQNNFG
jgi:hypothetical protein